MIPLKKDLIVIEAVTSQRSIPSSFKSEACKTVRMIEEEQAKVITKAWILKLTAGVP